jgi:hypothetical protein
MPAQAPPSDVDRELRCARRRGHTRRAVSRLLPSCAYVPTEHRRAQRERREHGEQASEDPDADRQQGACPARIKRTQRLVAWEVDRLVVAEALGEAAQRAPQAERDDERRQRQRPRQAQRNSTARPRSRASATSGRTCTPSAAGERTRRLQRGRGSRRTRTRAPTTSAADQRSRRAPPVANVASERRGPRVAGAQHQPRRPSCRARSSSRPTGRCRRRR